MANIARAYEFPSAQTARSEKKEGNIYSIEPFDCAPKTPAWDCKSCAKSCSFFYSLQCLWQNALVHLLPGLAKYNTHTRFLVSTGIYIRVFGFSFALKATYIRVFFCDVISCEKIQKNTYVLHDSSGQIHTYLLLFPLIFRMHIRVLSYSLLTLLPWPTEHLFLLRSCLSELPCKMFQTSWVKYSGKRAHCCIWARGCSEAAIWARGCSEAAWSRPAPCMAKKTQKPEELAKTEKKR